MIGMLWYIEDKKAAIETGCHEAVAYYRSKYPGEIGMLVLHQADAGDLTSIAGIPVKAVASIQQRHVFVIRKEG